MEAFKEMLVLRCPVAGFAWSRLPFAIWDFTENLVRPIIQQNIASSIWIIKADTLNPTHLYSVVSQER